MHHFRTDPRCPDHVIFEFNADSPVRNVPLHDRSSFIHTLRRCPRSLVLGIHFRVSSRDLKQETLLNPTMNDIKSFVSISKNHQSNCDADGRIVSSILLGKVHPHGCTPLHAAALRRKKRVVRAILALDADSYLSSVAGMHALGFTSRYLRDDFRRMLIKKWGWTNVQAMCLMGV